MEKYTLMIKLVCRIQFFNLDDQLLQIESRQILFSNFEPFQIYVNSNLYKKIFLCVQLSLLARSKGEQYSLETNIEASFTFSGFIIFVGHARLLFPGQNSSTFGKYHFVTHGLTK